MSNSSFVRWWSSQTLCSDHTLRRLNFNGSSRESTVVWIKISTAHLWIDAIIRRRQGCKWLYEFIRTIGMLKIAAEVETSSARNNVIIMFHTHPILILHICIYCNRSVPCSATPHPAFALAHVGPLPKRGEMGQNAYHLFNTYLHIYILRFCRHALIIQPCPRNELRPGWRSLP